VRRSFTAIALLRAWGYPDRQDAGGLHWRATPRLAPLRDVKRRPVVVQALRTLLYLTSAVAVAPLTFGVLLGGWLAVALLAVTPGAVPALVAFQWAVRALASLEAWLARTLLDTTTRVQPGRPRGRGFWAAGGSVLADGAFWRQQVFLALRMVVGSSLAIGEASAIAAGAGLAALPVYYRHADTDFGFTRIDSLGKALACLPVGIAVLVLALAALLPTARVSRALATGLLGGTPGGATLGAAELRRRRVLALAAHATGFAILGVGLTAIWASTTPHASFWPKWALVPVALPLAVHGWIELLAQPRMRRRIPLTTAWAIHAGVTLAVSLFLVAVWLAAGAGYPWPAWPVGALVLVLAAHALVLALGGGRIRQLERTRAGAVEAQESELRRIERDLHDGAQASLVAVGMTLGLAEQRLARDPDGARELLAEARIAMRAALEELGDLARGIHPPILTDRGLAAAVTALADRSVLPVEVEAHVPSRPAAPVETAAYFVTAEAIANAAKHAGATAVHVRLAERDGTLVVEVTDDGRGGADPGGSGLRGLRQRVEALDGRFAVDSPAGGPTTVRAELPCAS